MTANRHSTKPFSTRLIVSIICLIIFTVLGPFPGAATFAQANTLDEQGKQSQVPAGAEKDERGRLRIANPESTLAPFAAGDENWDDRFLASSVNGVVNAVAMSGFDMYIGGQFSVAGNNIARWDSITNRWYPLGSGVGTGIDDKVYAVAVSGNSVYVGGHFITAGGISANGIARWDIATNQWQPLGSGVNGTVNTIAISQNNVYVGGNFTLAGGTSANRIARWDGVNWYPMGSGVSYSGGPGDRTGVLAIAATGSNVYVGGDFTSAGGLNANYIARWDGSQWHSLGTGVDNGVNGHVWAIGATGSKVYVGGAFTLANGVNANNIAQWDGNRLQPLGIGSSNGVGSAVYAITTSVTDVYVGGYFSTAGGLGANHIARWAGGQWWNLGSGVNNTVYALAANAPEVFVGGAFTVAGNKTSTNFGVWQPCPSYFVDVQQSDYYFQSARALRCMGVLSGYSDHTFRPHTDTTRAQLSKMIVLARGWQLQCPATGHFTDVTRDSVYYCFIETAYEHRIITGYDDHTFRPNALVTRGQLSKILVIAMGWELYCPTSGRFNDVARDNVFYCYIETALAHNVITGYWDGTFQPNSSASRAQISKMVYQATVYP